MKAIPGKILWAVSYLLNFHEGDQTKMANFSRVNSHIREGDWDFFVAKLAILKSDKANFRAIKTSFFRRTFVTKIIKNCPFWILFLKY